MRSDGAFEVSTTLSGELEARIEARAGVHYSLLIRGEVPKAELFAGVGSMEVCLVESDGRPGGGKGTVLECTEVTMR